jgi:hypothetical protein
MVAGSRGCRGGVGCRGAVATSLAATLCLFARIKVRLGERSDRRGIPAASVTIRAPTAAHLPTDHSPVSTSMGCRTCTRTARAGPCRRKERR